MTLILAGVSDFETVAEDPCCDDVVTIRPTHVHGCHHPLPCNVIQCLGNGLSTSASKSSSSPASYPCFTLHAMSSALPGNCLQWFWRRLKKGAWWAHERCLFRSATVHPKVFQRPAIPKIDNNFLSLHLRFLPSQWSARPHALGTLPVVSGMP